MKAQSIEIQHRENDSKVHRISVSSAGSRVAWQYSNWVVNKSRVGDGRGMWVRRGAESSRGIDLRTLTPDTVDTGVVGPPSPSTFLSIRTGNADRNEAYDNEYKWFCVHRIRCAAVESRTILGVPISNNDLARRLKGKHFQLINWGECTLKETRSPYAKQIPACCNGWLPTPNKFNHTDGSDSKKI
ncbi:hypothetical protein J6590_005508 [Homalodisca vitripennis]|nr:hypothetical protein J6590_005508 [Homalodisca vitripennis]